MTTSEPKQPPVYIYSGRIPGGEYHPLGNQTLFYGHRAPVEHAHRLVDVVHQDPDPSWAPWALGSAIVLLMALIACVVVR